MIRAAGLLALLWLLAGCASALADLPIPPQLLVVRVAEMPGFAPASVQSSSTASAFEWAHGAPGTWTEAQEEASLLESLGFQEGVREYLLAKRREGRGAHREAVSEAAVLPTASAAESALRQSFANSLRAFEARGLAQFADRAIPGALGLGNFSAGRSGGDGNVFFATGRCFFVVGDAVHDARTRAQENRGPLAGALALYRRARHLCA